MQLRTSSLNFFLFSWSSMNKKNEFIAASTSKSLSDDADPVQVVAIWRKTILEEIFLRFLPNKH